MNTKPLSALPRIHEEALAQTLGIPYQILTVKLAQCSLNYFVAGDGPTVLLLHGANFGWGVWHPNIVELSKHFKIIALDLPGAGRSQRIDYSNLEAEELLAVVEEFVTKLNINDFSVVGCSIGGWIGLKLALQLGQRVRAVVTENGVGFADYMSTADKVLANRTFASLLVRFILRPVRNNIRIELFLRGIFANKQMPLCNEFLEYFYETMASSHNLLFISRLSAISKTLVLQKSLPQLMQPVCVIWGASDHIMPLQKNQPYFNLIPNVQVIIYEKTGHIPSLESPDRFNADIIKFITNVVQ